ncbi:hypothetical protein TREES_T100017517 [Tupaia chinensis]|uniref:Uncharacterized protein n=1 Tax=Tupaia chinensis TaxID=246437 RepID=L9LCG2_TUPCH|nr:hypothetical protein TREES_T100017517 [Tupaia chinensis]
MPPLFLISLSTIQPSWFQWKQPTNSPPARGRDQGSCWRAWFPDALAPLQEPKPLQVEVDLQGCISVHPGSFEVQYSLSATLTWGPESSKGHLGLLEFDHLLLKTHPPFPFPGLAPQKKEWWSWLETCSAHGSSAPVASSEPGSSHSRVYLSFPQDVWHEHRPQYHTTAALLSPRDEKHYESRDFTSDIAVFPTGKKVSRFGLWVNSQGTFATKYQTHDDTQC